MNTLICTIDKTKVFYDPDSKIITFEGKGNVDTDGPGGSKKEDPDWQPTTSVMADGKYINLHETPVIVIPPALCLNTPKGVFPLGSFGTMQIKDGPIVDCVVGEIGPEKKIGEYSVFALKKAGFTVASARNGIEDRIVKCTIYCNKIATINGITYTPRPYIMPKKS